jgi:hypothetical protein
MKLRSPHLRLVCIIICASALPCVRTFAQSASGSIKLHLTTSQKGPHNPRPAVLWLDPIDGTPALPYVPTGRYTLLQKDRMFSPHLQVIPIGSVVQFPNADPFFHNVFSMFNGKRFDLGLYEAGSSKAVTFNRVGVSYIFCNIHPEMSAVVLSLATPLSAIVDPAGDFVIKGIPPGSYRESIWIEGVPQPTLDRLSRTVHIASGSNDLGNLNVPLEGSNSDVHANKFGHSYDRDSKPTY